MLQYLRYTTWHYITTLKHTYLPTYIHTNIRNYIQTYMPTCTQAQMHSPYWLKCKVSRKHHWWSHGLVSQRWLTPLFRLRCSNPPQHRHAKCSFHCVKVGCSGSNSDGLCMITMYVWMAWRTSENLQLHAKTNRCEHMLRSEELFAQAWLREPRDT